MTIRNLFMKDSVVENHTAVLKEHQVALRKRRAKGIPKKSTVLLYAGAFILIAFVVAFGYRNPDQASLATVSQADSTTKETSVNELVAVQIASDLAETAQLSVAPNVANLVVSTDIKSQLTQASDEVIAKPQVLQPTTNNRSVVNHTSSAGETATSIGAKYGISADTVKFVNSLTSDSVGEGKVLQILPVDGVWYTVKNTDTVESIAEKYKVDPTRIIAYNDLEISGIVPGSKIILPDGVLPATERPGYVAPRPVYTYTPTYAVGGWGGKTTFLYWNTNRTSDGNRNAWGNCTWYAWERRLQIGGKYTLPSQAIGNAEAWAYSLGNMGYRVNRTPAPGAVMQNGGGYGHVAVVESVAENGEVVVTEMNFGGWYNGVSRRIVPASSAGNYNYIHEKM